MSFELQRDVPNARSRRSSSATEYPRDAASSATPAPVIPPPTTTTSNVSELSASRASERASMSIQVRDHVAHGQPLGRPLALRRQSEVDQADEVLVVTEADGGSPRVGPHHLRRAPVARQ